MDDVIALQKASEIIARLPKREIARNSEKLYARTFRRLWNSQPLDLLAGNPARDTYQIRRAALHFIGRGVLVSLTGQILRAEGTGDHPRMDALLRELKVILDRIEEPLELHPAETGPPDFRTASPWRSGAGTRPVRGAASKKHDLGRLPDGWRERVWEAMPHNTFRDVVAAMCLCPARPAEYATARDDGKPAEGVLVERRGIILKLTTQPLKSHGGAYGAGESTVVVAIAEGGEPARHLAQLCDQADGAIRLMIASPDALRKTVSRAGKRVRMPMPISPYSFRSQWVADAKATFGSGADVAAGAGHSSLRSQSAYGRVEHGRRGGGGLVATRANGAAKEPTIPTRERLDALKGRRRNPSAPTSP